MMTYHGSQKIVDTIYCYYWRGNGNNCTTSLIARALDDGSKHILVDPGHRVDQLGENCLQSLEAAMERDGFRIEDVGLVICTHSHPDHFEAAADVVEKSGAGLALSKEEDVFYAKTGSFFYALFNSSAPGIKPTIYLSEGKLQLEKNHDLDIEILFTPGHTPGSVSLYIKEEKVLISGDVVFDGGVGRTDFPGGDAAVLRNSIDRLAKLDIEYLIPGHSMMDNGVITGNERISHNFRMVRAFL